MLAFGGTQPQGGRFVTGELLAGGSGGSARSDGVDAIDTDASNCMNLPAEAMEMEAPIRVHQVALACDSGGGGQYRGGLGIVKEFETLVDGVVMTHRGERHYNAASGSHGGLPGLVAHSVLRRAKGGPEEIVRSKLVTVMNAGDRLVVRTAGGGGYGDPILRDPAAVQEDLRNEKISVAAARETYGLSGL
jgi:N-methylhydantoinase B